MNYHQREYAKQADRLVLALEALAATAVLHESLSSPLDLIFETDLTDLTFIASNLQGDWNLTTCSNLSNKYSFLLCRLQGPPNIESVKLGVNALKKITK